MRKSIENLVTPTGITWDEMCVKAPGKNAAKGPMPSITFKKNPYTGSIGPRSLAVKELAQRSKVVHVN